MVTGAAGEDKARQPGPAVSRRALLTAFALIPPNTFFLVRCVFKYGWHTNGPIYYNTVTLLVLLALINLWLRRRRSRYAFKPGEMLTIYCVLGMATGLVGGMYSVGGSLPAIMTYPFWFSNPSNGWEQLLWPFLPTWLTVRNVYALAGFWEGDANPYLWSVIRNWVGPAFWWMTFMTAVMWVSLCLNCIVLRRWADEEKLAFPFVTVPVEIVDERSNLLRSRMWWIAVALSFSLTIWNAVADMRPSLPAVPLHTALVPLLAHRWPWEAITHRMEGLYWWPSLFGLCYLMPLDLLFSMWVFGALTLAGYVLLYYFGWTTGAGFPYMDHQSTGALLGLAVAFIWLDRRYFAQVLRCVLGLGSALGSQPPQALSYRTATLGAAVGIGYLWWFWARAQVPTWIVLLFFALYFAIIMMIARVRAQVGTPIHELYLNMPDTVLKTAAGPMVLGPKALGMLALLSYYVCASQENSPTPLQLETLKMSEGRMEPRRIATALALAVPVTVLFYFWAYVHFGYQLGMGTGKTHVWQIVIARTVTDDLDSSLRYPTGTDWGKTGAMSFGMGITLALLLLKLRFHWWPLHPIAYPLSDSWMMHSYGFVFLLVWLVKLVLMRYGGLRAHRAALPLFLGLLVGDLSAGLLRSCVFLMLGSGP